MHNFSSNNAHHQFKSQNTREYTDSYLKVKYTSARHRPKDCVCRDKIHRSRIFESLIKSQSNSAAFSHLDKWQNQDDSFWITSEELV